MFEKVSDAVLEKLWHFTIGFGRAGDTPAAKGSGVLVKYGEVKGILTCAHVTDSLCKLKQPVGIVWLNRGLRDQSATLNLNAVNVYAAGEYPWEGDDIAFIHLPAHLAANFEKNGVFLDAEKNLAKGGAEDGAGLGLVNAAFGMVECFTGETTRQGGVATTRLRGVLTPGTLFVVDDANFILECFEQNIPDLPSSFGGTSGGGLWRVRVRARDDGTCESIQHRLIGIASSEDLKVTPPRINCQGLSRIEALLRSVAEKLAGNG